MKYSTSLLLLLVFIFSSNMSFSSDSDLVGVWADTYGNYYDFQKDGAFYGYNMVGEEKIIGAIGTYRVVKQSLIINIKESQNDKINPGDMPRVDRLAGGKWAVRTAAHGAQHLAQGLDDDPSADTLVAKAEARQVVFVKEVAEGTVTEVVEQPGHAQQLLDEALGWHPRVVRPKRGVEVPGEASRDVHRPEGVLEPGVFRPGEDPARALELVDVAQPLHPRAVEYRLLADFAGDKRHGELQIVVDRIRN